MFSKKRLMSLAACWGVVFTVSAQASDFDRRYLAIDQSLHDQLINSQMVLGQSSNTQQIPQMQDAWESSLALGVISSVFRDHTGQFRMYYDIRQPGVGVATAVAFSNDGINWTKPQLNLSPNLIDDPNTNLIYMPPHPDMGDGKWPGRVDIFYDANAPINQRYKGTWQIGTKAFVATSSDGLTFSSSQFAYEHRHEHIVSTFYDTLKDKYVMYGSIRNPTYWTLHTGSPGVDSQRRGVALHTSDSWTDQPWQNVGTTVLDPEQLWDYGTAQEDRIRPDFYNGGISIYHGQYIGMPTTYYRDSTRETASSGWTGTGPQYPVMTHSLDGVNFTVSDMSLTNAHSILDLTPHMRLNPHPQGTNPNELEVGQIHAAPTIIELDDKLLIYYFVRNDTHYEGYPNEAADRGHYVTELRVDGFASVKADEGEIGEWITSNNIEVPEAARGLLVNAKVAGSLKVEVLDSNGDPIADLELTDSIAFTGDEISTLMKWQAGQFEQVAGQTVQLRFVVEDGEIYSFSFSPIPEPASLTLLGLGGALLLRRRTHRVFA